MWQNSGGVTPLLLSTHAGGSGSTVPTFRTHKKFGLLKLRYTGRSPPLLLHAHAASTLRFPDRTNRHWQLSRVSWQQLHRLWESEKHLKLVLCFQRLLHCQVRQTGLRLDSSGNIFTWTDAFCCVSTTKVYSPRAEHPGFKKKKFTSTK